MEKMLAIAIGERDLRRLKRWSETAGLAPEKFLSRLIGDERMRRKQGSQ